MASPQYTNYPTPKSIPEGPATKYSNPPESNPTLTGLPLVIVGYLYAPSKTFIVVEPAGDIDTNGIVQCVHALSAAKDTMEERGVWRGEGAR